jgi:hypothetical protein
VPRWQRAAEHSGGGVHGNEGKVGEVVLCSTWCGDKVGTTRAVATDDVRLPSRHRTRQITAASPLAVSRARTRVTGESRLSDRCD